MNFAQRLKELRLNHNLTQKILAEELNFSQSIICDWEKEAAQPTAQAIIALANYFNVSTDYLLGYVGEFGEPTAVKQTQPRDEKLLLQAYRQMSEGKKRALFQMLDLEVDEISKKKA